ncbi:hypothetical protein quinque_011510 [Culex quinquefasciatus]
MTADDDWALDLFEELLNYRQVSDCLNCRQVLDGGQFYRGLSEQSREFLDASEQNDEFQEVVHVCGAVGCRTMRGRYVWTQKLHDLQFNNDSVLLDQRQPVPATRVEATGDEAAAGSVACWCWPKTKSV